jgi:phosphoribosylcarboxyaminoimidazole (NCAIR) mutase
MFSRFHDFFVAQVFLAQAIPAMLAISSSLSALPVPKTTTALRTVQMVQQWIPMPDGVRLSATLYIPHTIKPGEKTMLRPRAIIPFTPGSPRMDT